MPDTATHSIELSWNRPFGTGTPASPRHLTCEWGPITNGAGDPDGENGLEPLMLVLPDILHRILTNGPEKAIRGDGTISATQDGDRRFWHYHPADGYTTTWELFPAHWWDGGGPEILIGRWPH